MADDAPAWDALEIRSYRTVFDLERRVYRIDRLRLNPGGVPVRGLLYFVGLVLATAVATRLPLTGTLLGLAPWYLRDVALPGGLAALLTLIRVDGRPFHLGVRALLRHRIRPSRVCRLGSGAIPGGRWHPPDLLILPDGSEHRIRRMRYRGPGAALVTVAHERIEWRTGPVGRALRRPSLMLRELDADASLRRGKVIELAAGCRMIVAPRSGSPTRLWPFSSARSRRAIGRGRAAP